MIRALFIAGCWRSGSTLLGDMLGAVPGFRHVGELHHVWRRGLELNWLCGCGSPFRSCPFWESVLAEWGEKDVQHAAELESMRRRIKREMPPGASPAIVGKTFPEYVGALGRLAEAVWRVSGARVLVDSTKNVGHAFSLLASGRVEMAVVHLIRDPRATVFSIAKRQKTRLDAPSGTKMLQTSVESATQFWMMSNRQAELLRPQAESAMTLRYEDLVRDPAGKLKSVVDLVGGSDADIEGFDPAGPIPPSHTVSGNPDRLSAATRSRIGLDDEWSRALGRRERAFIEKSTRNWMEKYGYV